MTTPVTIYHNQSCSKSLKVLDLLTEAGYEPTVVNYLTEVPSVEELKALNLPAQDLIRQTDPLYAELGLPEDLSDEDIYTTLTQHPVLIQRPIVKAAKGSLICRPVERVWDLVEKKP